MTTHDSLLVLVAPLFAQQRYSCVRHRRVHRADIPPDAVAIDAFDLHRRPIDLGEITDDVIWFARQRSGGNLHIIIRAPSISLREIDAQMSTRHLFVTLSCVGAICYVNAFLLVH